MRIRFRHTAIGWALYGKRLARQADESRSATADDRRHHARLDGTLVTLENTHTELWVHDPENCFGERCTVHKRSEHNMRSFPQHWRGDRGIMERVCVHGVGHPDPDEFKLITGADDGMHGCDGCCVLAGGEGFDERTGAWDPLDDGTPGHVTSHGVTIEGVGA